MKNFQIRKYKFYLPIIIFIVMITSIGLILGSISNLQNDHIRTQSRKIISDIDVALNSELNNQLDLINILCKSWVSTDNTSDLYSYERFNKTIPYYFNFSGEMLALNWIDSNGTIRFIYPYENNKGALNENIINLATGDVNYAFLSANSTKQMNYTGLIEFYQKGYGFASYFPLIHKNNPNNITGFFNAVFDLNKTFHSIFVESIKISGLSEYSFSIYLQEKEDFNIKDLDNMQEIYHYQENFNKFDSHVVIGKITALRIPLIIVIHPQHQNTYTQSYITDIIIILTMGLVGSILISLLIYYILVQIEKMQKIAEEKDRMAYALQVKQKLESLGELAGGIAHDFNNILAALKGNVELLKMNNTAILEYRNLQNQEHAQQDDKFLSNEDIWYNLEENSKILEDIDEILDLNKRIVNQISLSSRNESYKFNKESIIVIISKVLKNYAVFSNNDISIEFKIGSEDLYVFGKPESLFQVFMNLILNAADAMEGRKGKITIEVQTKGKPLKSDPYKDIYNKNIKPILDKEILCKVSDTGKGIPKENLSKIFDPFFTTKKNRNKGIGLGLSVVYNVVTSMGGSILVHSELGVGTTFEIYLPLIEIKELDKSRLMFGVENVKNVKLDNDINNINNADNSQVDKQVIHLLWIEDELQISQKMSKILERYNIKTILQSNGLRGFQNYTEMLNTEHKKFDCVILDVKLPGMDGVEIYKKIKQINPSQPIIFITGYSDEKLPSLDDYDLPPLIKPFSVKELLERINSLRSI